jgi:hypothetical protein
VLPSPTIRPYSQQTSLPTPIFSSISISSEGRVRRLENPFQTLHD